MSPPRPKLDVHRTVGFYFSTLGAFALAASTSSGCSDSESGPGSGGAGGSSGSASTGGASGSAGAGGKSGSGGAGGSAGSSGSGGTAGSGGSSGAAGSGGSSGAAGNGGVDLDELGKPCVGEKCPAGLTPVKYCGIAGCDVGSFCSCEIPCTKGPAACPPGTTCAHISDGPGDVCVKN